ncbi:MAG: LexA family protein [Janthinobacterium lividum]
MSTNKQASAPQLETLEHIRQYITVHGYSPTISDLAESAGVARNCIAMRLGGLIKFGLITKTPGIARSVRVATNW